MLATQPVFMFWAPLSSQAFPQEGHPKWKRWLDDAWLQGPNVLLLGILFVSFCKSIFARLLLFAALVLFVLVSTVALPFFALVLLAGGGVGKKHSMKL